VLLGHPVGKGGRLLAEFGCRAVLTLAGLRGNVLIRFFMDADSYRRATAPSLNEFHAGARGWS
jgi:hypothetical protein